MNELKELEKKGKLSAGDLDVVHKLTASIKNIDKIELLEEGDYSEATDFMGEGRMYGTSYADDMSYARGRGRNAKRDSRGRYSRDGGYSEEGNMSYARGNRGYRGGNYSYGSGEEMLDMLEEMMEKADNEKQRSAIQKCMREIEKM